MAVVQLNQSSVQVQWEKKTPLRKPRDCLTLVVLKRICNMANVLNTPSGLGDKNTVSQKAEVRHKNMDQFEWPPTTRGI